MLHPPDIAIFSFLWGTNLAVKCEDVSHAVHCTHIMKSARWSHGGWEVTSGMLLSFLVPPALSWGLPHSDESLK